MSVTYAIRNSTIVLESDSKDNPIIPHIDSNGKVIADWDPPYSIVEGLSCRISGKTATLSMSGKSGRFTKVKMPVDAILALAAAVEECMVSDSPVTMDTIENLDRVIDDLSA